MKRSLVIFACALVSGGAFAQTHTHGASSYVDLVRREIKALSNEQIADLRAGRGMSFALPAELNGYPGPSHVLELAAPLALTQDQRARTESLFREMQREAAALGERMIDSERRLDALFASGIATPETLTSATAETALLQREIRFTHLKYHLEMKQLLTSAQVASYNSLRGYEAAHPHKMK